MARIQVAGKKSRAVKPEPEEAVEMEEEQEQPAPKKRVAVGRGSKPQVKVGKPVRGRAAAAASNGGGRSTDDIQIRALTKQNPCREGSFCYAQVAAAITSKSVGEAQEKLDNSGSNPSGRRIEVAWLVSKGIIKTLGQ